MVAVLLIIEFIMLKSKFFEQLIGGKPIVVIDRGVPVKSGMKKLRMPMGELEARLRQHEIKDIAHIEYTTIEPNGEIGFRWKKEKKTSTYGDIQEVQERLESLEKYLKEHKGI